MGTVLDSLVIELTLNTESYDRAMQQALDGNRRVRVDVDKTSKTTEEANKRSAASFAGVRREVLGLLAALGVAAGFKEFISSSVTGQAALGRLSQNLGLSARELRAWGTIAKEVGGQAEDATSALQGIAQGLAEASTRGSSAFTEAARANGIALTDQTGKVLRYDQILINISRRLAQLPRQQAQFVAGQLGLGQAFNLLSLGPDTLQARLAEAQRLSRVTAESTQQAQKLQYQWALLQGRIQGIADTAFAKLEPVLIRLATRFANWLDSIDWDAVSRQIEQLVNRVLRLVDALGGWKAIAIALGVLMGVTLVGKIATLMTSLGALLGLFGGVGTLTAFAGGLAAIGTAAVAAGAAVGGVALGKWLDSQIKDTSLGHMVGRAGLTAMGAFGDRGAQDALALERWGVLSDQQRVFETNRYRNMTPKQRAAYEQEFPGNARLQQRLAPTNYGLPRGLRNNNPGNLNFAGQRGAELESGPGARFAHFQSMDAGVAALIEQLGLYQQRGINTISSLVKTYAPKADGNNVEAYVQSLVKATGKGANEQLNLTDLHTLIALVQGITRHEGNGSLSEDDVLRGINYGARQRGVDTAQTPPVGASAAAVNKQSPSVSQSTRTSETHIGTVAVYTKATDARGIVRDMGNELSNHNLIAQGDTGVA